MATLAKKATVPSNSIEVLSMPEPVIVTLNTHFANTSWEGCGIGKMYPERTLTTSLAVISPYECTKLMHHSLYARGLDT
jgi:hypothetical protein